MFATQAISKGEVVAEYYGSIVSAGGSEDEALNEEDKLVEMDKEYCVIGRGLAARANDIVRFDPADYLSPSFAAYKASRQFPLLGGRSHNAKLSVEGKGKVWVKAVREIGAGE